MDFFNEIYSTLTRNKWRSLLTALGVFWGVMMLVILMGLGRGIQNGVLNGTDKIATNSVLIINDATSMPYKGFKKGRNWSMTEDDMTAIISQCPQLEFIAPVLRGGGSAADNVVRGIKSGSYRVMGFDDKYTKAVALKLLEGRFINSFDERDTRKVCVIGSRVKNDLFNKDESAVGKTIRVNGIYYTVVGVVDQYSETFNLFGNTAEFVIIPFSTIQKTENMGNCVHCMIVSASKEYNVDELSDKITSIVRQRNNIHPNDEMALLTISLKEMFDMIGNLLTMLNIFMFIVGFSTLLSGAIGVSNIMLITVRERTVEIGIRRALGATPWAILRQVMMESLALTLMAGLAAVVVSVGLLSIISSMATGDASIFLEMAQVDFATAVMAVVVLTIVGVFAGYLPARRALEIKPIEALSEE